MRLTSYLVLKGISKLHHFRFDKESPGSVFVRKYTSDENEKEISLQKRGITWPSVVVSLNITFLSFIETSYFLVCFL